MKKVNNNGFSVALGLFDYINPIFYSITSITIISHMKDVMNKEVFILYVIGAVISIIFGLAIPTVKTIVGLGIMEFKMPVNLVAYVNTGIFISGCALITHTLNIKTFIMLLIVALALLALAYIYYKTKKINTIAVLIGAVGYMMIYISLITISIRCKMVLPACLYALAICLFIFLVLIGIKSNLMKSKVHWVIEISNVICQFSVALATIILFTNKIGL